ncbi:hypothetical protein CEXT_411411 [Caerostris extrusa]|uniref:Uncharacterized protein n=1 Tax=Caerostris extrusa TaxID=172846 RepID=A0AAV4XCU1_CAEEX|nr:hypothetical protein CEXT_411411 [Caerostris extrusa]
MVQDRVSENMIGNLNVPQIGCLGRSAGSARGPSTRLTGCVGPGASVPPRLLRLRFLQAAAVHGRGVCLARQPVLCKTHFYECLEGGNGSNDGRWVITFTLPIERVPPLFSSSTSSCLTSFKPFK